MAAVPLRPFVQTLCHYMCVEIGAGKANFTSSVKVLLCGVSYIMQQVLIAVLFLKAD